ncbi:peptide-methionine (R)-S-oxide reductase MsrB [Neoroseomonas oryzicola]|uniref:peptide-methionine (R)-S-oxide reductase n=1 Tax=Neoroseomonas oryzicola TaxID=535904 RepID=A0A9X9WH80_9PROT|nr:peptide-methionine (R)-S-oxide reductase MsrB [Neoroseomonas oryzicola]MBR0659690.1 peptide-methionine (R)-S-oxide reductase MsrB [Neoroseomonas oryzicola]NKE17120.1 peptide-methionine (R)-S-oxide reductase MsrB [Neoroseomonas oryzicola]
MKSDDTYAVTKTEAEWREALSPEAFRVLRQHGTERPGTSPLNDEKRPGTFACAGCGQPLFAAETKYESCSGWPSFFAPIDQGAVGTTTDRSFFMTRTEVHCSRCGGHLGHVFPDGPEPTGLRYCMNGVSLTFVPKGG